MGGKLNEDITRRYTKQILTGLAYIHAHNIMHRDIKSDNILLKVCFSLLCASMCVYWVCVLGVCWGRGRLIGYQVHAYILFLPSFPCFSS